MTTNQNYLDMLRVRELARVCTFEKFREIIYNLNPFEQSWEMMQYSGSYNTIGFDIFIGEDGVRRLSNKFECYDDADENASHIGDYRFSEHIKFKVS